MKRSGIKAIAGLLAVMASVESAHAVDYWDAKITGIAIVHNETHIRFTIDKDENVVLTTEGFTGDQHKHMVALVMTAYTAQSPVRFIRSGESTSSPIKHYANAVSISVGSYAFN